ncbi:T9SS sorting signal type C domain-containing protein [Flavobacterium coralii]|uniref:T9SS sorting signal type C domain-containing protein n=1 Tax=Flavobacterium coralii TaxID=2838017 RepID=UPI000C411D12|nr:hypothetical protein [Flavobacterium sp.]
MNKKLRNLFLGAATFIFLLIGSNAQSQEIVFSDSFSTSAGTSFTTANGAIGSSPTWSMLRSGNDLGARINSGLLTLTNNASGAANVNGWILAYTSAANFTTPYNTTLSSNPGLVTWNFNMRQQRSNPSGTASGLYASVFVLAGTSNTTATTGTGYAILLGNSGKTDPVRLIRYTAGIRTNTTLLSSGASGFTDFGNQYLSVRVTYNPSNNQWQLYLRNDGGSFQDPSTGNFTSQGTVTNSASTGTALPLLGAFWNASTKNNQNALFDNISVTVEKPEIISISPAAAVAGSGQFTLTVTGENFWPSSLVRWNGSNRITNYVSPTQITATITATDIASEGTASVTVANGTAVSNSITFTINPQLVPSLITSTTALPSVTTVTGTASSSQTFTVSGANLTNDVTVTAPANFEVSTSAASGYADAIILPRSGTTLTGQPVTVYARLKASAVAGIYSGNITVSTTGAANRLVAVSGKVLAAEPSVSATGVNFTNVGASTFTVNWTNGNGAERLVVIRSGSAVDTAPADGVNYTASATFGSGSQLGTGNYVVYAGSASSVTVTGLTAATTYHVAVYEYNGSGGTQNYRATSPATGSRLTQNAPLGLQVNIANTAYRIDFDTTVDGVNNGAFTGGGVGNVPAQGELNSYSWAFSGFADGAINFGGNNNEDTAYDSGSSEGGETDPGLYGFEVAPGNYALGIQAAPADFVPGTVTFRFQNQTGAAITSLSVGYKVYVYNDETGSNSFNFSHASSANGTYTNITSLNETTAATPDEVPGWKSYYKVVTITGINVASNNYYFLRWTLNGVSGTNYDEIALDDVVIVANPTSAFADFNGTAQNFTVAGNTQLSGDVNVQGNISFLNNSWLSIGSNTLTLAGTITNTTAGGLRGSASSNLVVTGNTSPSLSFNQATPGTTNAFNAFTVNTTNNNTVTAANNLAVNGTLTVDASQTLALGTSTLTGSLSTIVNNGTITIQNTGSTPFTSGRTWGGTGTVILNAATAAQTLPGGTYNNVTVSTTGGASASGNVTVNGNLNLPNANPSATVGSFSTGANTLFMGPNAANTGTGDVSGTVTRNTGITSNKLYTFGHPTTSIFFPAVGTLPTSMSIRITLGSAPAGKPDGILRTYDFIQTGGSGTKAIISSHYLDSELNGNIENRLVDWVVVTSPLQVIEQGRSNFNTTENWVELTNVNVAFFNSTFGNRELTLAQSQNQVATWNGSQSDSWTTAANWTPNATPSDNTKVIIPNAATTPNDPILNSSVTIGTLTIEAGGILNTPTGSQLTITGVTGAWINNGTFNPGNGNVTFTALDATIGGETNFNNLTVASGASLRAVTGNVMRIAGQITNTGSLFVGSVENTVEYTGTNQTVITPNGALTAYHNLIISGTGATLPATLNIAGDLLTNQTVSFASTAVNFNGIDEQYLGGTVSPQLTNLTINKATGETYLSANAGVSGTLTLTSGLLNLGAYDLTLGTNAVAGSFSATTMIVADGEGELIRPFSSPGTYFYPIGEKTSNTTYSPIAVEILSGSFTNASVAVNVRDAVHPNNYSTPAYLTRYWNVTQTGITGAAATITAQYVAGDAVGGESNLSAAQLDGTFNQISNPWEKYTVLSGNTLTAAGAILTPGQTSVFTGIAVQDVAVSIVGEGTFCEGDEVTLSTNVTGGTPPYVYEWSGGLGSAATATPPTTAAGTTNYILTVRDANGITATDAADIIVTEAPEAGVLSGNQTSCSGMAEDPVTLSGYTGNVVRWEVSDDNDFSTSVFINNTTPTLTSTEIGMIAGTVYIRAVVQSGSCDEVYTDPITITTASTTWNGTTWSNGNPAPGLALIFAADYVISSDIEACSIQVEPGVNVTVTSGNNVTLQGAVTNNGGTYTIEDNANLIQIDDVPNTGEITVIKNSSPLYRLDYTIWSSPVRGQNLLDFSPNTVPNRFYDYSESQDIYTSMVPAVNEFVPGRGYLIRMPNDWVVYSEGTPGQEWTGQFEGVPNNGYIPVPMQVTANGYNMVGNPYPSPINIHDFFDINIGTIDQASALYFFRKRNDITASSPTYATITKAAYTANTAPGGDVGGDAFVGDPSEWVINSGQGFFVQAQGGTLEFTNSMRRAVNNGQFFRTGQNNNDEPAISRLWLNITGTNGEFKQAAIAYNDETTLGIDYGWDGRSFSTDGAVAVYTLAANEELAVQARGTFTPADVVPVGIRITDGGVYTITLDHVDGLFLAGQDIYLKDNLLNTVTNLKLSDYEFSTEAGIINNRFEIWYVPQALGTDNPVLDNNRVIVYQNNGVITIDGGNLEITDVAIFDVRGRLLYSRNGINDVTTEVSDLVSQQQMLILNITTEKGRVTKKIVY